MEYCISKPDGFVARLLATHSSYNNWTYEADTPNISSVIDAVLRTTTKVTERFAGDMLLELDGLRKAVEERKPYSKALLFYEDGVHSYPVEFHEMERGELPYIVVHEMYRKHAPVHIQVWLLTHKPDPESEHNPHCITTFRRMRFISM